jgi:hypothetical protein
MDVFHYLGMGCPRSEELSGSWRLFFMAAGDSLFDFGLLSPLHKPCETTFFEISSSNICFVQLLFLSLPLTQLVRKGERVKTYW